MLVLQSFAPEENNAFVPLSTYKPLCCPTPGLPKLRTNPEFVTHCTHATRVLGASPDGTAVVDPLYVRYAPPDKVVARPVVPYWSSPKLTPGGFDIVNPVVDEPAYVKAGVGIEHEAASAAIRQAASTVL